MRPIKVNKTVLTKKLQENRATHRQIFEEAVKGYRDVAIKQLEEHIERIRSNNKVIRVSVYITPPEDHTDDYDTALEMLNMCVDSVIEIDETTFRNYVRDDWEWKHSFILTNSAYSLSARRAKDDRDDD